MPRRKAKFVTNNEQLDLMSAAMQGDMVMVISPTTVNTAATSSAFTREVSIQIQTAGGEVHRWLNGDYTTSLAIADTSVAGTATIASTTLSLAQGTTTVTVSLDAGPWLAAEDDTLTVSNLTIMGYTVTGGTSVETFV